MIYANSSVPSGITRITSGIGRKVTKASESPLVHSDLAGKGLSFVPECWPFFLPHPNTALPIPPPAKTTQLPRPFEHHQWRGATLQKSNSAPMPSTEVEKWEDVIKGRRKEGASKHCPSGVSSTVRGPFQWCVSNLTMTLGRRHYYHCFTYQEILPVPEMRVRVTVMEIVMVMVMVPATIFFWSLLFVGVLALV